MKKILTISKSTFQEAVRDRIFIVLLVFGFVFIGSTIFLGSLSPGENATIMRDFGLAGIYLFTAITAIFSGANVVGREIERGTSRVILSKPVSEVQFVAGKFLGLWSAIALVTISMTALFSIVMAIKGFFFISLLWPNFLLLFEVPVLIALSILFGVLSSPLAGSMYTILLLFIGHSLPSLKTAAERSGGIWKLLGNGIYYALPNLEKFNLRNTTSSTWNPQATTIVLSILYAILYSVILLWLATLLLKMREE